MSRKLYKKSWGIDLLYRNFKYAMNGKYKKNLISVALNQIIQAVFQFLTKILVYQDIYQNIFTSKLSKTTLLKWGVNT